MRNKQKNSRSLQDWSDKHLLLRFVDIIIDIDRHAGWLERLRRGVRVGSRVRVWLEVGTVAQKRKAVVEKRKTQKKRQSCVRAAIVCEKQAKRLDSEDFLALAEFGSD